MPRLKLQSIQTFFLLWQQILLQLQQLLLLPPPPPIISNSNSCMSSNIRGLTGPPVEAEQVEDFLTSSVLNQNCQSTFLTFDINDLVTLKWIYGMDFFAACKLESSKWTG